MSEASRYYLVTTIITKQGTVLNSITRLDNEQERDQLKLEIRLIAYGEEGYVQDFITLNNAVIRVSEIASIEFEEARGS